VLAAFLLTPFVLAAALLNAPPLFAAWLAGRKLSDGPNVITLWRILVGAPLLFLWVAAFLAVTIALKSPLPFVAYVTSSLLGFLFYAPWKNHLRQSFNALRAPSLRTDYLLFRSKLLQELRTRVS
jgi:hypothetical protein